MAILSTRNLFLTEIAKGQSLASDFESQIIDFKEMNVAMIQLVTTVQPDVFDGNFYLMVSLLPERNTFVHYPGSERLLNSTCNNFGWMFQGVTFRYAVICYNKVNVTIGTVDLYARAKRT
jgi:hypothetical protein